MTTSAAIRPAQASDQDAVGRLISGIQRGEFEIDITLADQPDLADIEGFYRKGMGNFWIAEVDSSLPGHHGEVPGRSPVL